jgi:hypothetical protein
MFMINTHGRVGHLCCRFQVDKVLVKTKKFGRSGSKTLRKKETKSEIQKIRAIATH